VYLYKVAWRSLIATAVVVPLTCFLVSRLSSDEPGREELTAFLGTWTNEKGEPGNSIRFWEEVHNLPGMPSFIQVGEGRVTWTRHFGPGETVETWNYESWRPLRLNVTVAGTARVVPIRMLDRNHLLIRFAEDGDDVARPDVFDSPEMLLLTRTQEAE
jgi:hypothetical protein